MRMKPALLLGVLLMPTALLSPSAAADEYDPALVHFFGLRASYNDCLGKAGADTTAMLACIRTELAYQDKRLNQAYAALMVRLDAERQAKLKAEELRWIQFRNDRCADTIDGLEIPVYQAPTCRVEETGRQANLLELRAHLAE